MNDELFHQLMVNSPRVVCGRQLHPLCLYDLLVLERYAEEGMAPIPLEIDSPGWADVGATDLLLAVDLLSRDLASEPVPTVQVGIKTPPGALQRLFFPSWWQRAVSGAIPHSIEDERDKLKAHIGDYYAEIPMFRPETKEPGKQCNTPGYIALAMFMHRYTNLTDREIWTHPIGYILYLSAGLEEALTDASMLSQKQREIAAVINANPPPPENP